MMQSQSDIKEKVCMITGANSGIGKATAKELAKKGFKIVMVCRDKIRGEMARNEIIEYSGNNNVDLLIADLASIASVRNLAIEFNQKYEFLHILINNAGTFNYKKRTTLDGYESTFAVDYLAHFLLTNLLLDTIKKSAPARIINVSSNIHKYFKINFKDLMSEKKYASQKAYSNAKFALILFTYELAAQLNENRVTVNALHPGHAKTQMTKPTKKSSRFFLKLLSPIYRPPEKAAETSIYLASSPEVENITGKYFKDCKEVKSHKLTYDIALQKRLWDMSKDFVKL
jgi:NAD(P)-dependent dehydrogenase (short-subunit alcohol dehydrogenase family)